jgi:4-hydroxybenzoate polyprenyltransferase
MLSTLSTAFRVYQWPKNTVVFAALIFAEEFTDPGQIGRSVAAFAVFCALSSAVYLFNDLIDIRADRAHPDKRNRPIASGAIPAPAAAGVSAVLAAGGLTGAAALNYEFLGMAAAFLVLNGSYSLALKNLMIIDVLCIAISFTLRAIAGALALGVEFSNWLVVCTLFLALFLALGKRRREIELLDIAAPDHRPVLDKYPIPFVDALMVILAATTLLTYTIYTCSPEVVDRFNTDKLYVTLPFVVYGLFRYLYLVHHMQDGGDPSRTLFRDIPILATVTLWGVTCIGVIYYFGQ